MHARRLLHAPLCRTLVGGALLGTLALAAQPEPSPPSVIQAAPEVLRYEWRLEGFGGRMARLFVPGSGNGTLTTGPSPGGKIKSELLITSQDSEAGEFWRYAAEIDPATQATVHAWSSYRFRGKSKSKDVPVATPGAVDVSAAIHLLRTAPPKQAMPLQIWSEGKLYPVQVLPGITERIRRDGREVIVRRYAIEGVEQPGQRFWKGRIELALADDPAHVPVEIILRVSLASLRLRLLDAVAGEAPAG